MQLANPFTTRRVKEKTKEQQAVEAVNWKPKFCSFLAPQAGSAVSMAMAKCWPNRPAAAPVPAVDGAEVMQLPVDPGLLSGKRPVKPVKHINPRPSVGCPSVASESQARKKLARVRFQV